MMRGQSILVTILILQAFLWSSRVHAAVKADYYKLYSHLFVEGYSGGLDYNKHVRPVTNDTSSLFVYMAFSFLSLVDVNEKDQTLVTNVRIVLEWVDQVLSWLPADFGHIETILVNQENVWLPDIIVGNSMIKQDQTGYDELPVRLNYDGVIEWAPTVIVKTSCDIDVTYYPFDTQKCSIDFETAVSRTTEVDINIDQVTPMDLSDYSVDGSWDLTDTYSENLSDEDSKSKIRFTILLTRRTTFYMVNVILPVLFLSLTASLVFALPPDAGEKMGTGITVLLAYAVYLTIVSDHLPTTSLQVSLLALYLTLLLGLTAVSVVIAVFVLRLHHRNDEIHPVGANYIRLTLFLRYITCSSIPGDKERVKNKRNTVQPRGSVIQENGPEDEERRGSPPTDTKYRRRWPVLNMSGNTSGRFELPDKKDNMHSENSDLSDPPAYNSQITWSDVAAAIDWALFILFSSMALLCTIIFFLILTIGSEVNRPSISKAASD